MGSQVITDADMQSCPACSGTGIITYDEHHTTFCSLCCAHDQGVWQLTESYGVSTTGKWCCKAGCGAVWDTEAAYMANEHPSALGPMTQRVLDHGRARTTNRKG